MSRHTLLTVCAVAAGALALSACGSTEPAADADTSQKSGTALTLTDASGTEVKLDGPAKKVVGTEWNVVEHLVSLGVDPVGVADAKGYNLWDGAVPLKNEPTEIGTRGEPSMDTIATLKPDLIVTTTDLPDAAVKQLREVAPVLKVRSADGADQLGQLDKNLDLIAQATGTTDRAEQIKKDFTATLAEGKQALADAGLGGAEIAFADGYVASNQVSLRPYTSTSLIGTVNERLGLKNAWTVEGDKDYGLGTTDVEGLTTLNDDVQFAYIGNKGDAASDPFGNELKDNAVWKSLPFVKAGDAHRLPDGIWMFGGHESMTAYVDGVVDALTS
ncbi:iron-siderophore ABC transporter substrate-binding protein [Streptomyces sp. NPDC048290]|uniref:iron-siderophore ABC transporter substrate-binding protein n=1 Tax=Streptomyces sp. NPDC048290 TaxID=3155811 RepID=UPI00344306AC